MIRDPRHAFRHALRRGWHDGGPLARMRTNKSILDWLVGEVAQMQSTLGASDRQRMDQYLENIREIERRIQRIEAHNTSGEPRELAGAPAGVPDSFTEHMRLMFDIQVMAFEVRHEPRVHAQGQP
jgi:hypothetical protein